MPDQYDLQDFLEKAKAEYRESLSGLMAELEELVLQLAADSSDRQGRESLLESVHRVRGSAGSFGMDEVSKIAGEWECAIRDLPASPPPSAFAGMREYLARIRASIG
jgi:HPt (histidine-containing phosphotransfer) domain-containing protein